MTKTDGAHTGQPGFDSSGTLGGLRQLVARKKSKNSSTEEKENPSRKEAL